MIDDPQHLSLHVFTSLWQSRAIWLAARLRLTDGIGGRPTPAAVATVTGTQGGNLHATR
jgi:hypothetical protein